MKEYLNPILLRILYNAADDANNLWGILSFDAMYNMRHNA